MKVLRFYGPRDLRIEEEERREIGEDEVRVKILWCGICATDVLEFISGPILYPKDRPIIPGHEFGGRVLEVGKNVKKIKEGDLVFISPLIYCGKCKYCRAGRENICVNVGYLGLTEDGGFREEIVLKESNLYKAPKDTNPELLIFGEPVATAIHASLMGIGEKFLVVGFGNIGYILSQVLREMGGDVSVLEAIEERRKIAREMGFKLLEDEGERFDTVFEVAGTGIEFSQFQEPIRESLKYVDSGGKLVIFGIHFYPVEIDFLYTIKRELSINTSYLYTPLDFEKAVNLISTGKIKFGRIITRRILLNDIEEKGFVELETNKKEHIKIIVTPFEEVLNELRNGISVK